MCVLIIKTLKGVFVNVLTKEDKLNKQKTNQEKLIKGFWKFLELKLQVKYCPKRKI